MHEIAIGDPIAGYTVLQGSAISGAAFKATPNFVFNSYPFVDETLDIQLKGTSFQINTLIYTLETIIQRAVLYDKVSYASPQYLRFQLSAGAPYFLTPISNMHMGSNQAGLITQEQGSKVIFLHYTRPNYFVGPKTELPLSGRAGDDITGGYPLLNHTDSGINHGSTVLIKKSNILTTLPAPLRFQYFFDTWGAARAKDFFTGIFHHPTYAGDDPFFAYYNSLTGGTNYANAGAIQGYYKRLTWTSGSWSTFTTYLIDTTHINYFDGRSYRPILHLFATHAYTDLYFKVQIERYGDILYVSEAIYSPPGYGYVVLPPVELPPNYLLREVAPSRVQVCLYAWRISGATTTVDFDCLTLFPLNYAATFYGFNNMEAEQSLIDDSFRERFNMLTGTTGEITSHARVGGPLLLFPDANSRFFMYVTDHNNLMPIAHLGQLRVFYYPRLRLL